jgi:hypothetical protein
VGGRMYAHVYQEGLLPVNLGREGLVTHCHTSYHALSQAPTTSWL